MVDEQNLTRVSQIPKVRGKKITLKLTLTDTSKTLWAEQQFLDRKLENLHFNIACHELKNEEEGPG